MGEKMVQHKNENSEANLSHSHQSKSTISREHDCESESRGKRNGLSLGYEANLKRRETVDKIDGVATNSANKGILSNPTRANCLNYGENDLNCWRNVSQQHGTESSCSNSLLSNHSRQETGKEGCSFRNSGLTVDSSNSESVEGRSEEPALVSSESDALAHVVDNAVRNAMKVSSYRNEENGDLERAITTGKRAVCSNDDDSDSLNLRNKAREGRDSPNEPDKSSSFLSDERIIDPQSAKGCNEILAVQGNVIEVGTVALDCESTGNESSGPSMVHSDKVAVFDLNEDLNADEMDDYVGGQDETIPSPKVIRVVAKAGIPRASPMSPLKFEGRMGWSGSAKTSAFRNVAPSKSTTDQSNCSSTVNSPKRQESFSGIDLNVAAVEAAHEDNDDHARLNKRPKIDLNFSICDPEEGGLGPVQPSAQPRGDDSLLVDLNVNASTEDKSIPLLSQVSRQPYGNQMGQRKEELNYAGNSYWGDGLRTMQQQFVGSNAHGQQYLVAGAPPYVLQPIQSMQRSSHLQPMLPFAVNALPPQNYISTVPFQFGPSNVRPSPGTIPYVRFPQEQGFSTQMLYPGNVQQSLMAPPRLLNADVKGNENLADGSKKIEAGPPIFLGEAYHVADHGAWYGTPVRRKESMGGSSYQQHGSGQSR